MKKDDCIFCKLANGEIPTNALYEDDIVKVIFDANPAAKGHVLILPKEHFDNIYELDDDTAAHVFKVAAKISKAYKKALDFDGLNIVQNNGEVAGQTVFHFHMHIIPRIKGDTVKVIAGKDKDKEGKVISVNPKKGAVLVEGVNMVTKHTKPSMANQQGGIVEKEAWLDASNVMVMHEGKATRVGFKMEGDKKVRFAKTTGKVID